MEMGLIGTIALCFSLLSLSIYKNSKLTQLLRNNSSSICFPMLLVSNEVSVPLARLVLMFKLRTLSGIFSSVTSDCFLLLRSF
jgi:hypothetical protein